MLHSITIIRSICSRNLLSIIERMQKGNIKMMMRVVKIFRIQRSACVTYGRLCSTLSFHCKWNSNHLYKCISKKFSKKITMQPLPFSEAELLNLFVSFFFSSLSQSFYCFALDLTRSFVRCAHIWFLIMRLCELINALIDPNAIHIQNICISFIFSVLIHFLWREWETTTTTRLCALSLMKWTTALQN